MDYIHRELEKHFLEASRSFKAVMVTGARQVGKSTMLKHLAEGTGRTIVSLSRKEVRELAKSDTELFFQTYKPPVLIDEIQKAPELFEAIKVICDETDEKGLFWLTGSESKKLIEGARESLAGRVANLKLYGFSQREKLGLINEENLDFSFDALCRRQAHFPPNDIHMVYEHIWRGGMPDAQDKNEQLLSDFYESYIDTYLLRDAIEDNGIQNTRGFYKLLKACAAFSGELLNYSDLAAAAEVTQVTAKEWVRILQNMGIIILLEPYANNELKRLVKCPKLYFCDTGLCAFLSMWTSKEALMNGAASGHYYENYVVMELIKNYTYNSARANVTYYRDRNKKEIDLVIEDAESICPLEIKKSANPDKSAVKSFDVLDKTGFKRAPGGIICMYPEPFPIDKNNCLIPGNLI